VGGAARGFRPLTFAQFESPAVRAENTLGAGGRSQVLSSRYRVRLATRRDLHALPTIERAAALRFREVGLDEVYGRCFISAEDFEARQHRGVLWVASNERDRPVGFATCSQIDGIAHLDEIDVLPQHGRRGLGSQLLQTICTWARSRAHSGMTLSTTRCVPWNEPFYRRRGFHEVAETAYTVGLHRLRAAEAAAGLPVSHRLIMKRDLACRWPD
jgi:GNAT superfamily N-acetyltransferase